MVTILKKGMSIEKLKELVDKVCGNSRKGIDTRKYSGILKSKIDPLAFQKKARDEWK